MAKTFRQVYKWLVPPFLLEGEGALVLESLSAIVDSATQRLRSGLEARFPSYAGESALALIGRDRGIVRGRSETAEHYAARLIAWRYPRGHRVRGSAFALLEQFSEYFGGVDCWTIDVRGSRHDRTAAGEESYSYGNAWDWDGEGATPNWGRFFVVLDLEGIASEQLEWSDPDLWGGAFGDPDYTIGQLGINHEDVLALRRMMTGRAWKPAGVRAEWVIVSLDGTEPTPDGTWLHWSRNVAGVQTPTRSAAHRYWSLSPAHNNVYAGDPDSFAETFPMLDGTTYDGDPTSFPTSFTLPGGSTYSGNPDNFPSSLQLVDDGDIP
jgi:hypothetical protein